MTFCVLYRRFFLISFENHLPYNEWHRGKPIYTQTYLSALFHPYCVIGCLTNTNSSTRSIFNAITFSTRFMCTVILHTDFSIRNDISQEWAWNIFDLYSFLCCVFKKNPKPANIRRKNTYIWIHRNKITVICMQTNGVWLWPRIAFGTSTCA